MRLIILNAIQEHEGWFLIEQLRQAKGLYQYQLPDVVSALAKMPITVSIDATKTKIKLNKIVDLPPAEAKPKAVKAVTWKAFHTLYVGHLSEYLTLEDIINLTEPHAHVVGAKVCSRHDLYSEGQYSLLAFTSLQESFQAMKYWKTVKLFNKTANVNKYRADFRVPAFANKKEEAAEGHAMENCVSSEASDDPIITSIQDKQENQDSDDQDFD